MLHIICIDLYTVSHAVSFCIPSISFSYDPCTPMRFWRPMVVLLEVLSHMPAAIGTHHLTQELGYLVMFNNTCIPYHHIISSYSEMLLIMDFRWSLHSSRNLFSPHGQLFSVVSHASSLIDQTASVPQNGWRWDSQSESNINDLEPNKVIWAGITPALGPRCIQPGFYQAPTPGPLAPPFPKPLELSNGLGPAASGPPSCSATNWKHLETGDFPWTYFLHLFASWAKLFLPRVVSAACRWFWGIPMIWSTDQIQKVNLDMWLCPQMYQMIYSDLTWHVDQTSHLADQFLLCKKNHSQSCLKIASQKWFRRGAGNDLASQPHG